MNLDIKELRKIDNEISLEFDAIIADVPLLLKSKYKYTSEICFIYVNSTQVLKDSILNTGGSHNYYSINVLYRSLIEHYLRFNFFFFNFALAGKNDSYSHKFKYALEFNDNFSILKSINSIENTTKIKTSQDIKDELYKSKQEYLKYKLDDLDSFAKQLTIKNIVYFTAENIDNTQNESRDFLKKLIVQYSKLSSFVHGGIFAHQDFIAFSTDENRNEKLKALSGLSLQAATFIKMFTLLILSDYNKEYLHHYFKITSSIYKLKIT